MFIKANNIYFVGIGGIGMSAIAEILLDQGFKVSGSDQKKNPVTDRLESLGVPIFEGHKATHLPSETNLVIYTSATQADNPEIIEAKKRQILCVKRSEALGELMRLKKYGIGIAGTHGKTTTTSMVSLVLVAGGLDPTVLVGGKLSQFGGTNARLGKGDFIVVEADEYDHSFLNLSPTVAVVTNIEADHLDIYGDFSKVKEAFGQYILKVPFFGFVVLCADDPATRELGMNITDKRVMTYGLSPEADLRATNIAHQESLSSYDVEADGNKIGTIHLQVPGDYNIRNSLAAITIGLELGIKFEKIKEGIEKFTGVYRRWEKKGEKNDILVYDDYAHHPSECRATLEGVKKGWERRLVVVFQPHLYSRTRDFYKGFAKALALADVPIVVGIYPAREKPIEGVSSQLITDEINKIKKGQAIYLEDKEEVPKLLEKITKPGDLVITMGAGDIYKYGEIFLAQKK